MKVLKAMLVTPTAPAVAATALLLFCQAKNTPHYIPIFGGAAGEQIPAPPPRPDTGSPGVNPLSKNASPPAGAPATPSTAGTAAPPGRPRKLSRARTARYTPAVPASSRPGVMSR